MTGLTDAGGVVFEFSNNTIDTTGGTLTLLHNGDSQGITFRPTFSGSGFNYSGPVVIDNGGGTRQTVLQSTNTSGIQTWSGDISGTGSFLRDGGGETILSGNNSYTGDTTVLAGMLSITHPYLASSADVQLSTGGKLDLNFTGTDTIDQLFFDGVATSMTGTWGSTSSGATHQDDSFFSGTGMFMVTNPAGSGIASVGVGAGAGRIVADDDGDRLGACVPPPKSLNHCCDLYESTMYESIFRVIFPLSIRRWR